MLASDDMPIPLPKRPQIAWISITLFKGRNKGKSGKSIRRCKKILSNMTLKNQYSLTKVFFSSNIFQGHLIILNMTPASKQKRTRAPGTTDPARLPAGPQTKPPHTWCTKCPFEAHPPGRSVAVCRSYSTSQSFQQKPLDGGSLVQKQWSYFFAVSEVLLVVVVKAFFANVFRYHHFSYFKNKKYMRIFSCLPMEYH